MDHIEGATVTVADIAHAAGVAQSVVEENQKDEKLDEISSKGEDISTAEVIALLAAQISALQSDVDILQIKVDEIENDRRKA